MILKTWFLWKRFRLEILETTLFFFCFILFSFDALYSFHWFRLFVRMLLSNVKILTKWISVIDWKCIATLSIYVIFHWTIFLLRMNLRDIFLSSLFFSPQIQNNFLYTFLCRGLHVFCSLEGMIPMQNMKNPIHIYCSRSNVNKDRYSRRKYYFLDRILG